MTYEIQELIVVLSESGSGLAIEIGSRYFRTADSDAIPIPIPNALGNRLFSGQKTPCTLSVYII
jgi:hypothetical protein